MKEKFKEAKGDFIISSLVCIAFGVFLILKGQSITEFLERILGAVFLVIGLIDLFQVFVNGKAETFSAIMGAIVTAIGIWVLIEPNIIQRVIFIVVGVLLIFHGGKQLLMAFASKQFGYLHWKVSMILGAISISFGVICIVDVIGASVLVQQVLGVALIYSGVSNIWVATRATKSEREYHNKFETIDVVAKED